MKHHFVARAAMLLLAGLLGGSGLVHADDIVKPKQFKSVDQMVEWTNDYSAETGTFKVLKRSPLHIQLKLWSVVKESGDRVIAEEMFRALQWGVFRTFAHTNAKQVTVTVIPPAGSIGMLTETVTREKALVVIQRLLGVRDFGDLLKEREGHQLWSDAMKRCRFSDYGAPGLKECTLALVDKE